MYLIKSIEKLIGRGRNNLQRCAIPFIVLEIFQFLFMLSSELQGNRFFRECAISKHFIPSYWEGHFIYSFSQINFLQASLDTTSATDYKKLSESVMPSQCATLFGAAFITKVAAKYIKA